MSTGPAAQALAMVAAFRSGDTGRAWRLDRGAVADRLAELIADPTLVRQGRLNLCGPAALFTVWFARNPVGAVRYATELFETGCGRIGEFTVAASPGLMSGRWGQTERARSCPQADWMMMASLRDATNRVLRYSRPGGLLEAAGAITLPAALRRWLVATGRYTSVRDETNLVRRKPLSHADALRPGRDHDVFLLVAQEMFHRPTAPFRRARNRVASLVPNHWVVLRSPVRVVGDETRFAFWSWGALQSAAVDRAVFARCYYGALCAA